MPDGSDAKMVRFLPETGRGLSWPDPVDDRLDTLVSLVADVGGKTTRKEVVAVLIASAPADGAVLTELLHRYRLMTTEDFIISQPGA